MENRYKNSKFIKSFLLLLCGLTIISGRFKLNRYYDVNINIEIGYLFSGLIFSALIMKFLINNNLNKYYKILSNIIFIYLLLVIGCIVLSMISQRPINAKYVADITVITIICTALVVLIENKFDFIEFLICLIILAILIGVVEFILWNNYRIILYTAITSSRILIFGLTLSLFLYCNIYRSKMVLISLSLIIFYLFTNSLKINFISLLFLIITSTSLLFVKNQFKKTVLLILIVLISFSVVHMKNYHLNSINRFSEAISSLNNDYTKSRKIYGFTDENISDVNLECRDSQNPNFCTNNFVIVKDTTERIRLWMHAINLIKLNPFTGIGEGGYNLKLSYQGVNGLTYYTYNYPHNLFLNIAIEFGVIYSAIFFLIIYICILNLLRYAKDKYEVNIFIFGIMSIIVSALTGGDFYDSRYIFYLLIIGFVYINIYKNN